LSSQQKSNNTMKVLLINVPSKYGAFVTSDWDRKAEDIGAFPPIGLSYLAGYLLKHSEYDVTILDAVAEGLDYEHIEQRIVDHRPTIVGMSVFTPIFYDVLHVARMVKKNLPDCYVCIGGVNHARMYLNESLEHPEIDFVVRGEGEVIFKNLLDAIDKGTPLAQVEGISFRENGEILSPGPEGYITNINDLPSPAFEIMPLEKYKSAIGTGRPCGTIATSRGCPHQCTYCDRPYRTYRSYNQDRILSEIGFFYKKGIREFVFFDDMFNLTPARVIEISDAIIKEYPDIIWSFRGRADQVTKEMAIKAKKAGCVQMMFGVEAAKDADLKAIKKRLKISDVKNAINICKNIGVETSTNWIIGLPVHKSVQDVQDLLDTAIECGSDYAQFNIMIPYEGTEIFDDGVKKKILPAEFWREYVLNPTPNAYIPMWEEFMSREELSQLLKRCYRKFYLRPGKIVKNILKLQSYAHFKAKLRGVLTILGVVGGFKRENT